MRFSTRFIETQTEPLDLLRSKRGKPARIDANRSSRKEKKNTEKQGALTNTHMPVSKSDKRDEKERQTTSNQLRAPCPTKTTRWARRQRSTSTHDMRWLDNGWMRLQAYLESYNLDSSDMKVSWSRYTITFFSMPLHQRSSNQSKQLKIRPECARAWETKRENTKRVKGESQAKDGRICLPLIYNI